MPGTERRAEELDRLDRLAARSLALWDLPDAASAQLINLSENATYLVEAPGGLKAVLRVHRGGYHTRRAIECELAWIDALRRDGAVAVPRPRAGRDGAVIQRGTPEGPATPRFMVLFDFIDGVEPDGSGDLCPIFEELGAIAARLHEHVGGWDRPPRFERPSWDLDAVFGPDAIWGDWRAAPHVDGRVRSVLEGVEELVRARLDAFGKGPEHYGLIHADMRMANLLVDGGTTRLIDFDDCGFGWFLYDFAAAVSFVEDDPRIPKMRAAWLRGYRVVRDLPPEAEAEIETFVMLRRMALLAWIGSHIEAPEPQALAPDFARVTAELGTRFIEAMGARSPRTG